MGIIFRFLIMSIIVVLLIRLYKLICLKADFQRDVKQLLNICFGNHEQVNRLIQFEKDRDNEITDHEACRRAIERQNHDNH